MKDNSQNSVGAFLGGVVTTIAVGGYLLFVSKNSKLNRRKVDLWLEDAKEELLVNLKKVKNLTQEKYDEVVDELVDKYADMKDSSDTKIRKLKRNLKDYWEEVKEDLEEEE